MSNLPPKAVSTFAAAGLLLAGSAPAASAETLHRNGASTVTIRPAGAPAGAKVSTAVITVKKGTRTVAVNQRSYRATKGTYRVTSTLTYRAARTVTLPAGSVWAECRVDSKRITDDRTSWRDYSDGTGYFAGQVTARYSGTCTDTVYDSNHNSRRLAWTTSWSDDKYLVTEAHPTNADWAALKLAETDYKIGDVDYVDGEDVAKLPTYTTYAKKQTTKETRTVRVR